MSHEHDHEGHPPLPEGEEVAPPGVRTMALVRWGLVALAAMMALGAFAYSCTSCHSCSFGSGGSHAKPTLYHCPMHPSVIQDHPGSCPMCGMDLVPVNEGEDTGAATPPDASTGSAVPIDRADGAGGTIDDHDEHRHDFHDAWYCPMHPLETWPDSSGKCPVCGMNMVERKPGEPPPSWIEKLPPGHEGHRHNPNDEYFCPMHPLETSPDGSGLCPMCKMEYLKRDPASAEPLPEPGKGADAGRPSSAKEKSVPQGLVPIQLSPDRIQLTGMVIAPVERGELTSSIRATGSLAVDEGNVVRIEARTAGWIETLPLSHTGEKVEKGQVVATLYSPDIFQAEQEYASARAFSRSLASDALKKLELLGVSPEERASLAASGKPSRALTLRSPITGVVLRKSALKGLYVQPGAVLFELADLDQVHFFADLNEGDLSRVEEGASATLKLDAYPGETFDGKVELLAPALDPETRTLRARLSFTNISGRLKPGLYGTASIGTQTTHALLIPREALVDTGHEQYVFLAKEGGHFEPRRVKVGSRSGEKIEITDGLAEGDSVVATGNFLVDSESRLRAAVEGMGKAEGNTP